VKTPKRFTGKFLLGIWIALSAAVGYMFGSHRQDTGSVLPVQQKIPLEFYLNEHSFSEIENTKSTLEALCQQFLTELQSRHHASALGAAGQPFLGSPLYRVDVPGAIQELEQGIKQFKGTDQELVVVRELLFLLKREALYDRWLDVYLSALYRHPTHALIADRVPEAERISEAAGRQYELANAFEFLRHIPVESPAKEQLGAVAPRHPGASVSLILEDGVTAPTTSGD